MSEREITDISEMPARGVYQINARFGVSFARIVLLADKHYIRYYMSEYEATTSEDWNPIEGWPLSGSAWYRIQLQDKEWGNGSLILLRDDESEVPS